MVLGIDQLLSLVNDPDIRLVVDLGRREIENPEGTGFDLRVGKLYRLVEGDTGFLHNDGGSKQRRTPQHMLVAEYMPTQSLEAQAKVIIDPGGFYLIETMEKMRVPEHLLGFIQPRTTLFRSGLALLHSFVAPGYGLSDSAGENGATLTFGLINFHEPFEIQVAARVANIVFMPIQGRATKYQGKWQAEGGRVRTDTEQQV